MFVKAEQSKLSCLSVYIYAKNVVINNTNQKLQFAYDRAHKAAGQDERKFTSLLPVSNVRIISN